jgi:hypothetical protein
MPRVIEYFGDGMILLNEELATGLHTHLEAKLSKHPVNEIEIRLAEIATHCDVILDGVYDPKEIDKLCATLAGRLQVLREKEIPQIILPFTPKGDPSEGNSVH